MISLLSLSLFALCASAKTVLYDGRTPWNFTAADLDASIAPYNTAVKGSQNPSTYTKLLGPFFPPTPLWQPFTREQAASISITPTSIFVPGGNVSNSQYGFRRTELIARSDNRTTLEVGKTVFHFSILMDELHPLNYTHEYQIVFIEPNDGTHVFGIQLGTPFTVPSATSPAPAAHNIKVLDHALNVLFSTPFLPFTWHNFAVEVDWDARTLAVLFSIDGAQLRQVTEVVPNLSATAGVNGQGDFHWGVLKMNYAQKLPLANPSDTVAQQGDVVHRGIQENVTESLIYSGVFVEDVVGGIQIGYGALL